MKRRLKTFARSTTTKLAATYLLIIMIMSLGFSVVFYNASLHALHRPVPPDSAFHSQPAHPGDTTQPDKTKVREYFEKRAAESQESLLIRLVILNGLALVVGSGLSYYLARRSLRPIEAAMEAQSQFVSDASHELRTPLTVIQTGNEVALRNKKLTLAQAKAVIQENTEEAIKLQQLSNGLLNLAKQDREAPVLASISVQDVVSEALSEVVTLAQAKHIGIEDNTANVHIRSNQQMLRQVLVILLDNAIKYSPKNSMIQLQTASRGNQVQLTVKDEGIGIRASDLPHIFRRFYRADVARSRGDQHGYGLGLAIANALVEHHHGTLRARSELGKGSEFTVAFPRHTPRKP